MKHRFSSHIQLIEQHVGVELELCHQMADENLHRHHRVLGADAIACTMTERHEEERIEFVAAFGREALRHKLVVVVAPQRCPAMYVMNGNDGDSALGQCTLAQPDVAVDKTTHVRYWREQA